mmetsp:Transcript_71563/g.203023  ORF Transcript_71563/g.203023 Transcript_71563/m.203023 type:complete len:404 (-) Transcript_71563:8-1219(-)
MEDWDPYSTDGNGPVIDVDTDGPATDGDVDNIARIGKQDIEGIGQALRARFKKERPWTATAIPKPDLMWHTPTCSVADWRHHDVRMEVGRGIAYVVFNRPNENNSMQDTLGAGINDVLIALHERKDLRMAVFTGEGRMYCSGGDPKGWQAMAAAAQGGEYTGDGTVGVRIPLLGPSPEVQAALGELGGRALKAGAFPDGNVNIGRLQVSKQWHTWATLPQFTICLANGSAMGGGVGCVCCCDYVISVKKAYFVLSEVKIGVIPATISPYVIAKIGVSNAKRFFCAAENLSALRAKEYGIVDEVVENMREGHARIEEIANAISRCGPQAVQLCKEMVLSLGGLPLGDALLHFTCGLQATADSAEALEGLSCSGTGRPPPWEAEPIGYDVWPSVGVVESKKKRAQ